MEGPRRDAIVTPEAVALDLDVAGLGSRMIAVWIDGMIQFLIAVALGLAGVGAFFAGVPDAVLLIAGLAAAFVLFFGYFPLFEGLWNGLTPGKRNQHLRVVMSDGQPVTWGPVLTRNLLRLVDGVLGVGPLAIMLTKRSQRLGDLAAGTIVVHEHKSPEPDVLSFQPHEERDRLSARLETAHLGHREYGMVRSFLERRNEMNEEARAALARRLVQAVGQKIGLGPSETADDEMILEALVTSVRRRSNQTSI